MKTRIKIFGERNTGTRALADMLRPADFVTLRLTDQTTALGNGEWTQLRTAIQDAYYHDWRKMYNDALRDNQNHICNPLAMWKHAAPEWNEDYVTEHVHVIFMVRNPYSWLVSTAKKPYHMKGPKTADFQEFLSRPWMTEQRDNTKILLKSVTELWNRKVQAYIDFATEARMHDVYPRFIQFEDFVANPMGEVQSALATFQVPSTGVVALARSTKERHTDFEDIQAFYAQEAWKEYLTDENISLINGQIDWGLARTFGYSQLDPTTFPEVLPAMKEKQFAYEMMNLKLSPEFAKEDSMPTQKAS